MKKRKEVLKRLYGQITYRTRQYYESQVLDIRFRNLIFKIPPFLEKFDKTYGIYKESKNAKTLNSRQKIGQFHFCPILLKRSFNLPKK